MVDQALVRRRHTVRVLGYDVATTEIGGGDPPVVLVHGIGMSGRYFGPLAQALAGTSRVLVPDLPGFGDSTTGCPAALTIEEHADVVAGLVRALGADRPVLVGHSMGAQVVTEVAVRHRDVAGGVVLIGPVTEPGARSVPRQAFRLLRDAFKESLSTDLLMVSDWLRCGPRRYAATVPIMRDYRLEDRLGQVDVPVLLVRGSRDPVTPAGFLHSLGARASEARLAEVPGAAHAAMLHSPEVVAALIREVR